MKHYYPKRDFDPTDADQAQKLYEIMQAITDSTTLYDQCLHDKNGVWFMSNPTCTMCGGEIPDGHGRDCPWWRAYEFIYEIPRCR